MSDFQVTLAMRNKIYKVPLHIHLKITVIQSPILFFLVLWKTQLYGGFCRSNLYYLVKNLENMLTPQKEPPK